MFSYKSSQSKFFPLRVDPILEGLSLPGKETGYHNCLPLEIKKKTTLYRDPDKRGY